MYYTHALKHVNLGLINLCTFVFVVHSSSDIATSSPFKLWKPGAQGREIALTGNFA